MPIGFDYGALIDEDIAAQTPKPDTGLDSVATDTFGTYQDPTPKLLEPAARAVPKPVDYGALMDEDIAVQDAARNTILDLAVPKNPDKAARSQELAKRYGVRAEAVDAEFDLIDRKARVEDLKDMARESPLLLQRLTDPTFVNVAHDDVGALAKVERILTGGGGIADVFGKQTQIAGHTLNLQLAGAEQAVAAARNAPYEFAGNVARAVTRGAVTGVLALAMPVFVRTPGQQAALDSFTDSVAPPLYYTPESEKAIRQDPLFRSGAQRAEYHIERTQELRPEVDRWSVLGVAGEVYQTFITSILPVLATGKIAGAIGETGAALNAAARGQAAGTVAGTALFSSQVHSQTLAESTAKGLPLAAAQEYANWKVLSEGIPEALPLSAALKAGTGFLAKILKVGAVEGGQEGLTELADITYEINKFDANISLKEALDRTVYAMVVGGAAGGGLGAAAAVSELRQGNQLARAKETVDQNTEALKQLLAIDSKLSKRSPEVFSQFVADLTEGGVDSVYVEAAVLQQQAQKGKIDLTKSMPETVSQLQDALDMQGAVRIPLGEFVTALQGTPLAQSLLPMVRIGDANAPTQQELSDGKWVEETKAETEKIIAASGFDAAWVESTAVVEREFQTQLQQANRFTSDVNNAKAQVMATSYTVLAARLKASGKVEYADITPELAYTQWPINVTAEQPDAGQRFEQPAPREDGSAYNPQTKRWEDPASLNVGLRSSKTTGGPDLTPADVAAALETLGVTILRQESRIAEDGEPFSIPVLSRALTDPELHDLAVTLRQDAIPQHQGGVGTMAGPNMAAYGGAYSGEYYTLPGTDGKKDVPPGPTPRALGVPATASSISTARDIVALKGHPDYAAAKSGDLAAAARLVSDLVRPEDLAAAREKFGEGAVYAYPQAEEATGRNAIPGILANYYAENTGGTVEENIVQTNRAFHTGAKMMERMLSRPQFEGAVAPGRYVVVDDVSLSGSTLAGLSGHIQQQGGETVGTITLTDASRAGTITPDEKAVSLIKERFGNEIENIFGISPDALTAEEANYLVNFRDVDALRVSVATAKQARVERLRAKGVQVGALAGDALTGVHYSQAPRPILDGRFAGTGIKAQERKRLDQSTDPRIRDRIDFYTGEHRREPGLGSFRHDVELRNMYDGGKNPLGIPSTDFNAFESAVIDAGFDGYYTKGRAVLLGAASHNVETPQALGQEIAADKRLPDAVLTPGEWASVLATKAPDLSARLPEGVLDRLPQKPVTKDELGGTLHQAFSQIGTPQTETPAFKRWFGDSKVVDANGEPLVVYHGTRADFESFKRRTGDIGIHFGTAGQAADRIEYTSKVGREHLAPRIIPVFLGIKNPLRLADAGAWTPENVISQLQEKFPNDGVQVTERYFAGLGWEKSKRVLKTTKDIREFLQSKGYDGVVYKNTGEVAGAGEYRNAVRFARNALPADVLRLWDSGEGIPAEDRKGAAYINYSQAEKAYAQFIEDNGQDSYIAFERTQIKSAIGNRGTFDPNNPNTLFQSDTFYSELLRAVEGARQEQAPAADWKAIIAKLPGVKKEEIDFLGINVWLDKQASKAGQPAMKVYELRDPANLVVYTASTREAAEKSLAGKNKDFGYELMEATIPARKAGIVTKDDLLSFIEDNQVTVENVEPTSDGHDRQLTDFDSGEALEPDEGYIQEIADDRLADHLGELREPRNIGEYTDEEGNVDEDALLAAAGSDAYREARESAYESAEYEYTDRNSGYRIVGNDDVGYYLTDPSELDLGQFPSLRDAQEEAERDTREHYPSSEPANKYSGYALAGGTDYHEWLLTTPGNAGWHEDPHYPDFDGGEDTVAHVRFDSREDTGGRSTTHIAEIQSGLHQKARKLRSAEIDSLAEIEKRATDGVFDAAAVRKEVAKTVPKDFGYSSYPSSYTQVPNAPFKEMWPLVAIKTMIRRAVDQGHDAISWDTGETQVSRYQNALREGVDRIEWAKTSGVVHLVGYKATREVVNTAQRGSVLSDAIGKVMADRIKNDPEQTGVIEGDDITISDTGMAGFYDDILVKLVNSYVKPFGAKVEDSEVAIHPMETFADFSAQHLRAWPGSSPERMQEAFDARGERARVKVRILVITPALREAALAGQPLFQQQRASLTIPSDPNEPMTIALMKAADLSSFHHEGAHGFLEIMSRIAALPDAPVEIVDDLNKALKWFGIKGEATGEGSVEVEKQPDRGGVSYKIKTGGVVTGHLTGVERVSMGDFHLTHTELREQERGTGLYRAAVQRVADMYPEGLFVNTWEASRALRTSLAKMPTYELKGEVIRIRPHAPRTALEVWNAMSLDQKRPYHEQFARGYEMYLFEGKAPSVELDGLFARFRSWMVNVYRSLQGIKDAYTQQTGLILPDITDEMKSVYGRLLATDEQIKAAENARAYAPLFKTKPQGMTEDEWVTYQKTDPEATQEAVATLQTRGLRDMQWLSNARSRALKRLQKGAAEKRKAVRAEVADEVMAQPIYRAMEFLKHGVLDGEQLTGAKLSLPALKEMYGDEPNAPWRYLPTGRYSLVATEGLHPDQAAEILGFTSGDQLVRQLLEAEPARSVIAGLTDQRMLERYGDLADPAGTERAANMAIHNDARGRFIATEANALAKATGQRRLLTDAAKSAAEAMIARTKVRELRPAQYEAAEARAGRAAERAFGKDLIEAATQKRTQLANHYAARAAYEAVEETEKKLLHLKKLGTSGARKNMRGEFLEQLDAFLERFDLRTSTTRKKTATERVALKDWLLAEAERLGAVAPDISEEMLDERTRKSYKDMTVEELRGVFDTVRQLEHLARREQKMYTTLRGLGYHAEVSAILEDFKNAYPQAFDAEGPLPYDKSYAPKLADLAIKMRSQFDGEFVNPENLLSVLTLDKGRQALASLFGRLSNASDAHMAYMKRLATHLAPAADAYTFKERRAFYGKGIPVAGLGGREFTKNAIASIALYWGSADGRQRIQDGFGWNETQVMAILDKLDQKDWNFVDALWRMSDDMIWPDLKTLNERTKGIAPPKVEAMPYTTKFGEARGGYAPLVYDGEVDSRSQSLNNDDAVHELLGGTSRQAGTRQSASKTRVEKVTRKLDLSLSSFTYKINETVHDITHREAVADTWRLLQNNRIGNAIRTIGGPPVLEALKRRVRETAVKPIVPTGFTTKALWLLRRNTLINMMGLSFNTVAINVLGAAPAMREVGPVRFGRAAAKFANPATARKYFDFVMEKSQYMVHRPMGFDRDMNTEMSRFTTKATIMPSMATWFVGLAMMDRAVTLPTWLAAYEKHMEEGPVPNDIDASVEAADRAVRRTQGGGRKIDLADIAGGTGAAGEFKHLITMYYNFFSAQLGQMVLSQRIAKAQWSEGHRAKAAMNLTLATLSVVVIPAVLEALARGTCDESVDPAEWAGCLTRQSVFFTANFVPLARDVIPFAWSKFDPEVINFGVRLSPVVNALETLGGAPKALYDFGQGEANESDYRTLVRGTGYAFGLPGFQAWRTLDGYQALVEGESNDPTDLLTGPEYRK